MNAYQRDSWMTTGRDLTERVRAELGSAALVVPQFERYWAVTPRETL